MPFQSVLTTFENNILFVTLNSPEKLNALTSLFFREMNEIIDGVYTNPEIYGVVITGSGNKAFAAGADITEFSHFNKEEGQALSAYGHGVLYKIENCPKPIIAAVNGFALGGGCELAMACHFRLASDNARFGQPEVKLGIVPGYGGTQRLVQLVGKGKATELLMTGDFINAEEAKQLGLVNYVVPQDQLLTKALELMKKITAQSPMAIAGVVKCVNAHFEKNTNGFEFEIKEFGNSFGTKDFSEGTAAFIEKRTPEFRK